MGQLQLVFSLLLLFAAGVSGVAATKFRIVLRNITAVIDSTGVTNFLHQCHFRQCFPPVVAACVSITL
jgi:hypothetical protein